MGRSGCAGRQMSTRLCPHCKQPLRYQFDTVFLPAKKHALISDVKASGDIGVTSVELLDRHWKGQDVKLSVIKSHVNQINDILEETDFILLSRGRGPNARWYLEVRR